MAAGSVPPQPASRLEKARRASWILAATLVVCSAAGRLLGSQGASEANTVLVFLVGVVFVAVRAGRWASIAASFLSVLAFNFFFAHPVHTFVVHDLEYLFTFAVLLVTGLTVSELVTRAQAHAIEAADERLRATLLATVSHDMRTPLAAIRGTASTLLESGDELPRSERIELLREVLRESERLTRQVENLLQLGRLEDGRLRIQKEWYPLEELVGTALARLTPTSDTDRVVLDLPPSLPFVPVDAELIVNALVNLLENALRYAPRGQILVAGRLAGEDLEVEIADRGPGLAVAEPERLFERFVRGPAVGERGSGLGLAICRAIVEVHGGRIEARNRAGGGASFRLRLPLEGGLRLGPVDLGPNEPEGEPSRG